MRVPFKGGGDAVNSMMTGTTPIAIFGNGNVIRQHPRRQDRRIRGRRRQALAARPRHPDLREIGYTSHLAPSYFGIYAPAGTPQPIIDKFSKGIVKIASSLNSSSAT